LSTEISGIRPDIRAGYFSNIRQIRYPVGYEKALSGAPLVSANRFQATISSFLRPLEKIAFGWLMIILLLPFGRFCENLHNAVCTL
jgi:hypothetical protein